jgi:hypothetical protein
MGSAGADHLPRYHLWHRGRSSHCEELSKYLCSHRGPSGRCVGTVGLDRFSHLATGSITGQHRDADSFTYLCRPSCRHCSCCWIKCTCGWEPKNDAIFWITDRIAAWRHPANSNRTGSRYQWRNTVYMLRDTYFTILCSLLRKPPSVNKLNP